MSGRARRVQQIMKHVVVLKSEPRCMRGEVFLAPGDHPSVTIHAQVTLRSRALLDQLPREAAAAASEIEHGRVRRFLHIRKDQLRTWIVEELGLSGSDESSELDRGQRKIAQRIRLKDLLRAPAPGSCAERSA